MPISPSVHFNLRNIYTRKVSLIVRLTIPRTQAPGVEGDNTHARAELRGYAPREPGARGPRVARREPELGALGAYHPEGGQKEDLDTQRFGILVL